MVQNPIPMYRIFVSKTAESVPKKMKDEIPSYPKVRVREDKESDDHHAVFVQKRNYLLSLKDFEALFLQDPSDSSGPLFTGKKHHVSPSSNAKIPEDYSPHVVKPSTSESQEADKRHENVEEDNNINCRVSSNPMPRCEKVEEDNNIICRVSSIPMPRAVVSSPENDLMIGKNNKKTAGKPSAVKNHNPVQSRHARCKITPNHGDTENPINSRKLKEGAGSKCPGESERMVQPTGAAISSRSTLARNTRSSHGGH